MALPFTTAWKAERERLRRASQYIARVRHEPAGTDVRWLADAAANGDEDHALWELRYARQALGLLVAQRDSLDDQTAADAAHALSDAMARDERVALDKRELLERQFNERLSAYRDAMHLRGGTALAAERLGRVLLAFSSDGARTAGSPLAYAIELLQRYATEANAALREIYGEVKLPEDVPPSVLRQ